MLTFCQQGLLALLLALAACGGSGSEPSLVPSPPSREISVINDLDTLLNQVKEGAAIGSTVGITAHANDLDGDAISYSLENSAQGRFAVNANTGVITVAKMLDARVANSHTIVVIATSADTSESSQTFTIAVQRANGVVGYIRDADGAANTVRQDASEGTLVGITAQFIEPVGEGVSYRLDESANGLFMINQHSGIVTVANVLSGKIHSIVVRASKVNGLFSLARFTIAVTAATHAAVSIHFPLPGLYETTINDVNAIDVSGRVSDPARVRSLVVSAGSTQTIATVDSQGKWRAKKVALGAAGQKTIKAKLIATNGSEFSAQVKLKVVGPLLIGPQAVTLESNSKRAFIMDKTRNALLEMNLLTGVRRTVSDNKTGTGTAFANVHDLVSQTVNNVIYVVDENRGAIVAVNIKTGDRTLISKARSTLGDTEVRGSGDALLRPRGIVVDGARLLVASALGRQVVAVNIASGDREPLIHSLPGLVGLGRPAGICLAEHNEAGKAFKVAYISTSMRTVHGVYLDSVIHPIGTLFVVSDSRDNGRGVGSKLRTPEGMVCDIDRNRLLLVDSTLKAIFAVDINSGDRTLISGAGKGLGPEFRHIESLTLQSATALLVPDQNHSELISVDINTGNRSIFSVNSSIAANSIGTGASLSAVEFMVFDSTSDRVLVTDMGSDSVNAINLTDGNRSVFSDSGSWPEFGNNIQGITLHKNDNYALVSRFANASSNNSLLKVNLVNGERSVLSDTYPGINSSTSATPMGMALDYAQSRVLVADDALEALISVSLIDGASELISRGGTEGPKGAGVALRNARAVAKIDNALLVLGEFGDVVKINTSGVNSGDRSLFYVAGNPSGLRDMGVEHTRNRMLVIDSNVDALLAKPLDAGDVYTVSNRVTGSGTPFYRPVCLATDEVHDRIFVLDNNVAALFVVDALSGDRVVISR